LPSAGFFRKSGPCSKDAGQAWPWIGSLTTVVEPEQVAKVEGQATVGVELEPELTVMPPFDPESSVIEVPVSEVVLASRIGREALIIGRSGASLEPMGSLLYFTKYSVHFLQVPNISCALFREGYNGLRLSIDLSRGHLMENDMRTAGTR